MKLRAGGGRAGLALALALLCAPPLRAAPEPDEGWRALEGTWSASGKRQALPVEDAGQAVIVEISGAVVLIQGEGLSRGFRGQAIGFDDGSGRSVGRCVWTDEKGDRIYSRLEGEALASGRRFSATITGGTGRYAGLRGEFSFTWEYLIGASESDGVISGRATALKGRVRRVDETR